MPAMFRSAPDTNLVHAILRNAAAHPDRSALIDADDGANSVTYRRLAQLMAHGGRHFLACGLKPGQLAVLNIEGLCPFDDILSFLALTAIGVGVYASSMASQVEMQVADRLGIDHEIVPASAANGARTAIVAPRYEKHRKTDDGRRSEDLPANALALPWMALSSSGTTGDPKIFTITHEQAVFRRERYYRASGLAAGSIFMSFTSHQFTAARCRIFYALSQGASVVVQPSEMSLQALIEIARRCRVTHLYCVPTHLALCCRIAGTQRKPPASPPLLPDLENLETSSSIVPPDLATLVRMQLSPNLSVSYSVNEIGHISTTRLTPNAEEDAAASNIGVAVDGVEIAILDERCRPVARGDRGLIAVRFASRPLQVAYLDRQGQWGSAIRHGWFLPGDVGYFSPVGNLMFECRADDMMIFDGINIYPREIESVLESHAAVSEAAAFPVPSPVHGSIPAAAVTLRSTLADGRELVAYCRQRLGHRAPHHVAVLPALPRNAFGKILKRELAAMYREV